MNILEPIVIEARDSNLLSSTNMRMMPTTKHIKRMTHREMMLLVVKKQNMRL